MLATHKAFQVIGKPVVIETGRQKKVGILQESRHFRTSLEGGRPALDFICPLYSTTPEVERLAMGARPKSRVKPENPILSLHLGVDHTLLHHIGQRPEAEDGCFEVFAEVFGGRLVYTNGAFVNDGNPNVYDLYRAPFRAAGFKIA